MVTVLTGDIIKSRSIENQDIWLKPLKKALRFVQPNDNLWEIYRGDSFQLELQDNTKGFFTVVYIKSVIKMTKGLDVRLALGLGEKSFEGASLVESNGEAFQFSGETLESLKKDKLNLKIKTPDQNLNAQLNLYFKFALMVMDTWTPNSAEIIKLSLEHPNALQKDLGSMLDINQNAVSKRQKRAQLDSILELNEMYQQLIKKL